MITAYLVTKQNNQETVLYNGYTYKKYKGRAYASYFTCIGHGCTGQIVLSELKGGSIKIQRDHLDDCKSWWNWYIYINVE